MGSGCALWGKRQSGFGNGVARRYGFVFFLMIGRDWTCFEVCLGTDFDTLSVANFPLHKPILSLSALRFREWSLIDDVRPVMLRPFWVVRGIAVSGRVGRSR